MRVRSIIWQTLGERFALPGAGIVVAGAASLMIWALIAALARVF